MELDVFKRALEILGYELQSVKKSAEDVIEAWNALPPNVKRAIGDIKIVVELRVASGRGSGDQDCGRGDVMDKIETLTDILRAQRQAREERAAGTPVRELDKVNDELQKEIGKMYAAAYKAAYRRWAERLGVWPQDVDEEE